MGTRIGPFALSLLILAMAGCDRSVSREFTLELGHHSTVAPFALAADTSAVLSPLDTVFFHARGSALFPLQGLAADADGALAMISPGRCAVLLSAPPHAEVDLRLVRPCSSPGSGVRSISQPYRLPDGGFGLYDAISRQLVSVSNDGHSSTLLRILGRPGDGLIGAALFGNSQVAMIYSGHGGPSDRQGARSLLRVSDRHQESVRWLAFRTPSITDSLDVRASVAIRFCAQPRTSHFVVLNPWTHEVLQSEVGGPGTVFRTVVPPPVPAVYKNGENQWVPSAGFSALACGARIAVAKTSHWIPTRLGGWRGGGQLDVVDYTGSVLARHRLKSDHPLVDARAIAVDDSSRVYALVRDSVGEAVVVFRVNQDASGAKRWGP